MIVKTVKNPNEGLRIARRLLYKYVDKKTMLFLSGGTTPKALYKALAKEKKLKVGAVGMVDERYGLPLHKDSNERMLKETGLVNYFSSKKISFYPILSCGFSLGSNLINLGGSKVNVGIIAKRYNKIVKRLFYSFPKSVAIMGIGEDGHTAGLPARIQNSIPTSRDKTQKYVMEIDNFPGKFKKRITLTFKALSKMDLLIVLVFGSAKQTPLKLMFTEGSKEEIPARFYTKPEIAGKTILITDQTV